MADYYNLFTTVQAKGPVHHGVELGPGNSPRFGHPAIFWLLGKIGNAQLGPIYLGGFGVLSLVCGMLAFNIIGLNMLASVNWDPVQFVRQLFWLALEPPPPEYGLSMPPLNQGGWFLIVGLLLSISVLAWWVRMYRRAIALGMGTHVAWAFAAALWLFFVLGFFRPILMGSWGEAVPYGIFPTWIGQQLCPFATATCSTTRSMLCQLCSCMARCCYLPCMVPRFWRSPAMVVSARLSKLWIAAQRPSALVCSGVGPWGLTPPWNPYTVGLGGLQCCAR